MIFATSHTSYWIYMASENNLLGCFWFFEMVAHLESFENNI